jgi:TRAP-type C4-dicarboxylate transport system permease small subunit
MGILMKALRKIGSIFDHVETIMAIVAAVLLVSTVFAIVYDVFMRYFFNSPTLWAAEITRYALVYMTFLAVAWVMRNDAHVRVDILINWLNPQARNLLLLITSIIGAIVCLIIVWYGAIVTWESFQAGSRLETELRTPHFIVLVVVPFGMFMFSIRLVLKTCDYILERLRQTRNKRAE